MVVSVTNPYLDKLSLRLGPRYSIHTRRAFLGQSERFLLAVGTKPRYSQQDILSYVDRLVLAGHKETTINANLAGIRALFTANELVWPLDKRDLHLGLPQEEADAPVIDPADVAKLIQGLRGAPSLARTVIALVTIWGFRGGEVERIYANGCDGRIIEVQTLKGGRKRRHVVPSPALIPVLTIAKARISTHTLHTVFDQALTKHVRPPRPREGLHALRRSLVTGLFENDVSEGTIERFMGWRQKSISQRYNKTDPVAVDQAIYVRHPFLEFWLR